MQSTFCFLLLPGTLAFSVIDSSKNKNKRSPVPHFAGANIIDDGQQQGEKDRPLLHKFGRGIQERILKSQEGFHRLGLTGHYTSAETIPCLEMQCGGSSSNDNIHNVDVASRKTIRRAFTESSSSNSSNAPYNSSERGGGVHGRSSGSGCSIIRLRGCDAVSIRGLVQYADRFFERVDNDDCNGDVRDVGVFRVCNHVYAGFDEDVNLEGKMQFLDTRLLVPGQADSLLLPIEVGDLVGAQSLGHAHKGMSTLLDIGSQITSAVLGMDSYSMDKLIDDGTRSSYCLHHQKETDNRSKNFMVADDVSNSYQRLIRYLQPQQTTENDISFQAHVDSSFLTLIPMPELPGLEVWCPLKKNAESCDLARRGEWVRPIEPSADESLSGKDGTGEDGDDCAYVIAMAGEFLQLLSDGQVPTCIHRVIPPRAPSPSAYGFAPRKYKPRVSAPLFLRPRRGEEAFLDVKSDLRLIGSSESMSMIPTSQYLQSLSPESGNRNKGLYFEEGLIEECDTMRLWAAHESMMRK